MMWVAEADTPDPYKLLACVPRGARLYVLVAGPEGPNRGSGPWSVTVTPSTGQPLEFRSLSGGGSKTDSVYVAQFDDPPGSPVSLDIRIELDGVEVFSTIAMPVRTEPI